MLKPSDAVVLSTLSADLRRAVFARLRELGPPSVPPLRHPLERLLATMPSAPSLAAVRQAQREASRALRRARGAGVGVVVFGTPEYPAPLSAIDDPPAILWLRGRFPPEQRAAVAIVGSRAATSYAVEIAERLAADLAERGVTVISGLARGVDGAAHRGALSTHAGRTIAVLGSGIDVIYPPEHAPLAGQIALRGAVLTEYVPRTRPLAINFPRRNRIISGLSQAVVVVEAAARSGALITARCALEQGRDVMAVPGNALSGRNRGGHGLLRDGAKVVEGADDILDELRLPAPAIREDATVPTDEPDGLLRVLVPGEAYDLDSLMHLTGLEGPAVLARLLELELKGRVARVEGGRFRAGTGKVVT